MRGSSFSCDDQEVDPSHARAEVYFSSMWLKKQMQILLTLRSKLALRLSLHGLTVVDDETIEWLLNIFPET